MKTKVQDETLDGTHFEVFRITSDIVRQRGGFNRAATYHRLDFRINGIRVTRKEFHLVRGAAKAASIKG